MSLSKRKKVLSVVTAVGLAGLAACGSSGGSSSASGSSGASSVPKKTIGILNITAASESTIRPQDEALAAIKLLGWKSVIIDAQGDPQKEAAGMTSLVTQKVDAILSIANQPSAIQAGLLAAKAANIPVINIAGVVAPDPKLAASYAPDEKAMTKALDDYMIKQLSGGGRIATITAPAIYALALRDAQLKSDLQSTSISVAANHEIDFTNPVQDATKAVNDILTANPDVKAFWTDTDFDVQPAANVLKTKGLCGQVQLYGYYGDKANLQALRDGCATAVVDTGISASSDMAIDGLLGLFVHRKAIPAHPTYGEDFFKPTIIDKSNVPSDPTAYFPPPADYTKYFHDKWSKDYGV